MFVKELVIVVILGCFFLMTGLFCIVWPEKIREYTIKYSEIKILGTVNPFLDWIKTPNYILSLKIIGLLSILAFLIACYVVIQAIKN